MQHAIDTRLHAKLDQLLRTRSGSRVKSNQIGKHKKRVKVLWVHTKLGQLCELDPGHVSNQIGQQQKMTMKTLSAKFCYIYLQNFAKFRKINFNFVFCKQKNRLSYPPYVHCPKSIFNA
jgi:hypothetical protein